MLTNGVYMHKKIFAGTLFLFGLASIASAHGMQRVSSAWAGISRQTADSAFLTARCVASNADTVRVTWAYPNVSRTTVLRPASCTDLLRVAKGTVTQVATITFLPKRGATTGNAVVRTITIPARVVVLPPPTIDSASVDTIVAPPIVVPPPDTTPTGPPATPTAFTPNLPANMRLKAESSFETYVSGSTNADGLEVINWTGNTVESATTFGVRSVASTGGGQGARALRTWFPENHAGDGVGPLTITVGLDGSPAHYMSVRMRYMPGYVLHTNSEKLFYPVMQSRNGPIALMNVGPRGHLAGLPFPIEDNQPGGPITADGVIPIGRWFTAEFYAQMNTPGNADGIWQAWVDGVRVLNVTNKQFSRNSTTQERFDRGRLDFTRGGGPATILTPLGGQWIEVDRVAFYIR
jgi:hypothetical protein